MTSPLEPESQSKSKPQLPKIATPAEVKAILLANWPWEGNWGGMMDRMMEDMRQIGMLVECEGQEGYFHVIWPRGVEMEEMVVVEKEGKGNAQGGNGC
ncbi:hypothetical protein ONS95_013634 [Cadophora gregata]|uniref:uncharacterized protein n=1 Tax=Cadophora gregata TaxID=51156 RepID=UPI0026DBFE9A|nr:uncharacterized protein ONS95_013634 [Cadophora gregata]KAK0113377.1 hypothetical protein ONS96_014243 [Cadophora gregata f. sp. sojae]KAK0114132.1 hypothetical protein ONS95_013634 [Cadophora gregata]